MKNVTSEESCSCPLECDAINYSYYFVSEPFDPIKMCPRQITTEDFLMKEFYLHPMPPKEEDNKSCCVEVKFESYFHVNHFLKSKDLLNH